MEIELGLKITHTREDNITSHANLRIAKDHSGPLFLSRETKAMFILTAYLKGFRRENIDIKINEDGSQIAISGKRAVQELVLSGWIMHRKDVEVKAFKKVFRIPDGIILDRVKAKYNDEESSLTIIMPKLVKGMQGIEIEEVKEVDVPGREGPQAVPDKPLEESKIKEVEETEQIVQKEVEEPEMAPIPSEKIEKEAPKVEKEESGYQIVDQGPIQARNEVSQVFSEGDTSKEIVQEKPEKPEIENKGEIHEREFQEMQDLVEAKAEPEQSADDNFREVLPIETPPEMAESPATTATNPETATAEPEDESDNLENTLIEETQSKEHPDMKEQQKEQDIPEAKIKEEEKYDKDVRGQGKAEVEVGAVVAETPQESEKQEPDRKIQEPTEPEAEEEKNEAEMTQPEEGNVIKEEATDEEKVAEEKQVEPELGLPEVEEKEDSGDGETRRKRDRSKRSKLCPPLVIAGSAFLVSLIVLVINLIRAKRR